MVRKLCDAQLLMSVSGSLSVEGAVLNTNQVNDMYMSLLKEHHLEYGWLKDLILKHIQHVEFVKSVSPNEAETFTLSHSVIQAVANYTRVHEDPIFGAFIDVPRALRLEILDEKAWKFICDLGSFEHPPMLQVFLKQLLFGAITIIGERREKEGKETVDVACQLLIQNTHTQIDK